MTDAHCHIISGDPEIRELVIGREFIGVHPWEAERDLPDDFEAQLLARPQVGVGEIGLDRLRERMISPKMREVFERQLSLALKLKRPIALHGAKCWGEVVRAIKSSDVAPANLPPLLFHGFSRSEGLIPDIIKLNGFISVGPTILNDHAVNYHELVRKIPRDNLLIETDRTEENAKECPSIRDVARKLAQILAMSLEEIEALTDRNANTFWYNRNNHEN